MSQIAPSRAPASSAETKFDKYLPVVSLSALAVALLATNRWFTVIDDETAVIDRAAKPILQTIQLFLNGMGEHEHPPLYDLLFHGWLRLTNGSMNLLRLPAIVFFVLAIWILAKAAGLLGGRRSAAYIFWIGLLWPYGFHFGRVAIWYSFCFLLVCLVTLCYLKFLNENSLANWLCLFLSCVALVYSNYFGWAIIGCLAFDFALRNWKCVAVWWRPFLATGVLFVVVYIPLFKAFFGEFHSHAHADFRALNVLAKGSYNLYSLFVSESVAPWYWIAGVSAAFAVATSLIIAFRENSWQARRFLLYFIALLFIMTVLGIVQPRRLLLISAWLVLPVGTALGTVVRKLPRQMIVASLILVAAIGWFGIINRNLYAAPRWIEPWEKVAQRATEVIHNGGIVIANNPSFFFYLTYSLPNDDSGSARSFPGLMPKVRRKGAYDPTQWLDAGRPVGPTTLLVKGLHFATPSGPTDEAESWLDQHCHLLDSEHLVHDSGAKFKQHFEPQSDQREWRIEIRSYSCP